MKSFMIILEFSIKYFIGYTAVKDPELKCKFSG
jgi:hypothetical protein